MPIHNTTNNNRSNPAFQPKTNDHFKDPGVSGIPDVVQESQETVTESTTNSIPPVFGNQPDPNTLNVFNSQYIGSLAAAAVLAKKNELVTTLLNTPIEKVKEALDGNDDGLFLGHNGSVLLLNKNNQVTFVMPSYPIIKMGDSETVSDIAQKLMSGMDDSVVNTFMLLISHTLSNKNN